MAVTIFKDLWAIGLKTSAFVQSLFLFPFNVFLRAVDRFLLTRRPDQPLLPCSTSGSASSSPSTQSHNNDVDDVRRLGDSDMTVAKEPPGQNLSVSNMASTVAQNPSSGKENHPPLKVAHATPTTDDAVLVDGISRLEISQPSGPLKDAVDGTGSIKQDGAGNKTVQNGASSQPTRPEDISNSPVMEVKRSSPVPLKHSASYTSRLNGMTTGTELGGETAEIHAKVETPEQAAARVMHSRFMREALDMVSGWHPTFVIVTLRCSAVPTFC
jgi:hypothetical protein